MQGSGKSKIKLSETVGVGSLLRKPSDGRASSYELSRFWILDLLIILYPNIAGVQALG